MPTFEVPLTVFLFSDATNLGICLVDLLLSLGCKVNIVSRDISNWRKNFRDNISQGLVELIKKIEFKNFSTCNYLIVNDIFLEKSVRETSYIVDKIKNLHIKSLYILPFSVDNRDDKDKLEKTEAIITNVSPKIVYLGDLLEDRKSYRKNLFTRIIYNSLDKNYSSLFDNETYFYPIEVFSAAKRIIKILFSFSTTTRKFSLITKRLNYSELVKVLLLQNTELKLRKPQCIDRYSNTQGESIILETDLAKLVKDATYHKRQKVSRSIPKIKFAVSKKNIKLLHTVICIIIPLLLSPFILLAGSGVLAYMGISEAKNNKLTTGEKYMHYSKELSVISSYELSMFIRFPLIGNIFSAPYNLSQTLGDSTTILINAITLAKNLEGIPKDIISGKNTDIQKSADDIALGLDNIYKEVGFLDAEISEKPIFVKNFISKYISDEEIKAIKANILYVQSLVKYTPELLGENGPKTYLVLFQNNMELRPTGGFIGSYALATFDKGNLTSFNVNDVYSADGQLRGHVDPPSPIKDYLGEGGWYLRDSNWDPDFPTSAMRAEWFIEKELGQAVDGVVAIDVSYVKDLVETTGPITLSDFNETINSTNFYEKIQKEAEENFFPGSIRKASVLTALSRQLIDKIAEFDPIDNFTLIKTTAKNLESKHIQIFFNKPGPQKVISNLGFDGAVVSKNCDGNCIVSNIGLVEANLGVNKINYYVKRSSSFYVIFAGDSVKQSLTVSYLNTADAGLDNPNYKAYVRAIIPSGAEDITVDEISGSNKTSLDFDNVDIHGRKEIGVPVTILPGEQKSLVFSWTENGKLDFTIPGQYLVSVRKQAGVGDDPFLVKIYPQNIIRLKAFNPFSLTNDGVYVYNTNLTKDIFVGVSW